MTDEEILDLYFSRSEVAVSETRRSYGKLIRATACGVLRNNEAAEECENDTYLRAWNSIPPARPQKLRAYLCRIARGVAFDRYDRDHAQKRGPSCPLDELEEFLRADASAEDSLAERELTEHINAFLGGLERKSRIIFVRRYWFWDEISEISERMQMSESAVKTRLSRTMGRLRKYLRDNGYGA